MDACLVLASNSSNMCHGLLDCIPPIGGWSYHHKYDIVVSNMEFQHYVA